MRISKGILRHCVSPYNGSSNFRLGFMFNNMPTTLRVRFTREMGTMSQLYVFRFRPNFRSRPRVERFVNGNVLTQRVIKNWISNTCRRHIKLFFGNFSGAKGVKDRVLSIQVSNSNVTRAFFFYLKGAILWDNSFSFVSEVNGNTSDQVLFRGINHVVHETIVSSGSVIYVPTCLLGSYHRYLPIIMNKGGSSGLRFL